MAKAVANPMQIEYTKVNAEKITFTSNQLRCHSEIDTM